jgi:hypothetical protein
LGGEGSLMAKIRGFKPDLWTDEDFVEVSPFARLLWMGMWNFACDNGHLADKSKQIKMRVLPTDDVNCAELLRELESQGLITRADGWITVPNLPRHQKVDRRYFTTCLKDGCEQPEGDSQRETRRAHTETPAGARRDHASALGDGDGEVKGSDGDRGTRKRGTRIPEGFAVDDEMRQWATENSLGHLDLQAITVEFVDYWVGVAGAKGVKLDWAATWRNWIRRKAQDAPRNVRPIRTAGLPEGW